MSSTHLVVVVVVVLLVGATSSKRSKALLFQIRSGCGRNVLHVNTHLLTESDFRYDITVSKWWP